MNIEEYIAKMKNIEDKLINFLDQDNNMEENFEIFMKEITEQKILKNKYDFKIILYMINRISIDHHRSCNFFYKIDQVLQSLKIKMKENYANRDLFKIFKSSKRVLLFLFEEKIIEFDEYIYNEIKYSQYTEYFLPEIKQYLKENQKEVQNKEIDNNNEIDLLIFNKNRKKGENEGNLYKIIQEDSIEEFIIFVNKENYPLTSEVEKSIFETNEFLLNNNATLIDYAAFYGSNQIFKYLIKNGYLQFMALMQKSFI